jgi:hypothetical protein
LSASFLNDLNGAKRLNDWNDWNGLIPVMNGAKRLNGLNDLNGLRYFMADGIALLSEHRFQREKAAPKLLNRTYSALFFS